MSSSCFFVARSKLRRVIAPSPLPPTLMQTTLRRTLSISALAGLVAFVYWPGLHGFWGRDDFMQLAYVRLVGSPWPLFVHDHYFPVPGSIFRPLGFASFWLWQALFGTDYTAHAFADMLLHIAVSIALYRVVRFGGLDRVPAVLCTLLFAVHPAVLGPALWWSARFDLLAAMFGFVALRAALDYRDRQRLSFLLVALAATLAALLSKETALAIVVAVSLIWLHWAWTEKTNRANALRALAALWLVAICFSHGAGRSWDRRQRSGRRHAAFCRHRKRYRGLDASPCGISFVLAAPRHGAACHRGPRGDLACLGRYCRCLVESHIRAAAVVASGCADLRCLCLYVAGLVAGTGRRVERGAAW